MKNSYKTVDCVKAWLAGAVFIAMMAFAPQWARAGIVSTFAGHVAERVAEHQAVKHIEGAIGSAGKGQAPVPGLNSPLALPSGDGLLGCKQLFPRNLPMDIRTVNSQWRAVGLCSNHFAVVYSRLSKTPLFVVEKLNQAMMADAVGEERTNHFYPDPRLARGDRAELSDFVGSGKDRAHLANAADQPDQQSMIQSFALSNMIPGDPTNNRSGAWLKAEKDTRKYAKRAGGNVFVFSGPLFRASGGQQKTVGANRVWVPTHLFKLVYDEAEGRAWAFIMPDTAEASLGAPMSYEDFVRQTGWQLLAGVNLRAPVASR